MTCNLKKVFIIMVLCITIVFISGFLLPKYLSGKYFQFRREFKYDSDSRYRSFANLTSVAEKSAQNKSANVILLNVPDGLKERNYVLLEEEIVTVVPVKFSRRRLNMVKNRKRVALAKKSALHI